MTEWEKVRAGLLYNANHDASLLEERAICKDLCFQYNQCRPSADGEQRRLLKKLLGEMGDRVVITPPFWCDYGKNIFIGHDFYANHNCVILDLSLIHISLFGIDDSGSSSKNFAFI